MEEKKEKTEENQEKIEGKEEIIKENEENMKEYQKIKQVNQEKNQKTEEINQENEEKKQINQENEEKKRIIEKKEMGNSKNSKPILAIIIFIVLCLIGALAVFNLATSTLDGISLDFISDDTFNLNLNNGNNIEKIGNHEFKIPTGYEKQDSRDENTGGLTVSFMNEDIKLLYITDLNLRANLEDFAKEYGKQLGNEGVKLTINEEPAYKFEIQSSGYSFYFYLMNIKGDTYTFLISKETPNPDDFIAKLIIQ